MTAPPDPRISRRSAMRALLLGGAATVAITGGYVVLTARDDRDRADDDTPESDGPTTTTVALRSEVDLGLTPAERSLVAVGRRYLEAHPDEASVAFLLRALPQLGADIPSDPATGLGGLRDQVTEDFAAGDIVSVDGWSLARTEARAAALYAIER